MRPDSNHREIIDALNDALFVHELDTGIVVDVNERVCELYGFTRDELIGRDVGHLSRGTPPYSTEEARRWVQRAVVEGPQTFEWLGQDKLGRVFWVEVVLKRANVGGVERIIALVRDISRRKALDRELAEYRANLERSQAVARIGSWSWDLVSNAVVWSRESYRIFGVREGEPMSLESVMEQLHPDDREFVRNELQRSIKERRVYSVEHRIVRRDGALRWVDARGEATYDADGKPAIAFGVVQDITERKSAEEELARKETELRQAQKMEAIGRLAGGIAHDFNNLLTAIGGYSSLALKQVESTSPAHESLIEIQKASERAAHLTRQLLAFSRKQVLNPRVIDLNALVREMDGWLRRLIGENIEFVVQLAPTICPVRADPAQFEHVLANLVVNARDAMPGGGRLSIETRSLDIGRGTSSDTSELIPGRYVVLCVTDSGVGMDEATRARLFEPFFTTKELGKGTGLGLSTVYGIVRQSGGHISTHSEKGRGSVFCVYLPRVDAVPEIEAPSPETPPIRSGNETVLLVEDDAMVRGFTQRILQHEGFRVIAARDGVEALELCKQHSAEIAAVLTDVVMPRMGGRELAEHVSKAWPDMGLVFMSGYSGGEAGLEPFRRKGARYVQKPFSPLDLVAMLRKAIDARVARGR